MTCNRAGARLLRATAIAIVSLVACGNESSEQNDPRMEGRRVIDDEGAVCLTPSNGTVTVEVVFDACLAPGCDQAEVVSCSASDGGVRIDVSSHLEVVSDITPNRDCPTLCGRVKVLCGTIGVPDGSRTIEHGATVSEPVEFPRTDPLQVLGASPNLCDVNAEYFGE